MVAALSAVPGCQRCAYAGSLRRMRETIGDVDILAAADDSGPLMAAFIAQPGVAAVIVSGETKTSIRTAAGLQVDLRVVQLDAWGAALQYFTGSTAHNVAVRQIAVRNKLRLSEYGLFEAEKEGGRGEKMLAQRERVRVLDTETEMELLHGTELNIAPDGFVGAARQVWPADWPRAILELTDKQAWK